MFWDALSIVVDKVILPITSRIKNDDWLVQIVLILLTAIVYIVHWAKLLKKKGPYTSRLVNLTFVFTALVFIQFSEKYELHGLEYFGKVSYIHTIFVTVVIFEWLLFCKKKEIRKNPKQLEQPEEDFKEKKGFYSDLPTDKNGFDREKYAEHLIDEVICSFESGIVQESAFSILLSERFGMGKSSFIKLLKLKAADKPLCIVDFKPWLSRGSDQIIKNFFELLRSELGSKNRNLSRLLKSYAVLATESAYGKPFSTVTNELLHSEDISIESQYESIKEELRKKKQPILVIVDDVDRLQSDELMTLIKLLRNTADFPNIFYLVAADKIAISESIRPFNIGDVDLYLKKFFNLELLFPADDFCLKEKLEESIKEVLQRFGVEQAEIDYVIKGVLENNDWNEVFLNMRDVIRFKNQVVFNLGILSKNDLLKEIDLLDFYLLSIIQYIDETFYKILRDKQFLLLDVSKVDERYTLKKDFEEAFRTDETKRMFKSIREYKKDIYDKGSLAEEVKEIKHNDIQNVVTHVMSKNDKILSNLFNELFGKRNGYRSNARVCYYYEYFKYFSGKYRKDELSEDETYQMIRLPEKDFTNAIDSIVKEKKDYSLIFKCRAFIENEEYNRLNVLKNILVLFDASYRINGHENKGINELDYFRSLNLPTLVFRMYAKDYSKMNKSNIFNNDEEDHQEFLYNDKRYNLLSIILILLTEDERYEKIFANSTIKQWGNDFMNRYIREQLSLEPFELNAIKLIYLIKRISPKTWDEKLSEFIKQVQEKVDPKEWLYRLVKYERGASLSWNYDFIFGVGIESYDFITYANIILGEYISDELKDDLVQLSRKPFKEKIEVNEHPFFMEALEWWKKKDQAEITKINV